MKSVMLHANHAIPTPLRCGKLSDRPRRSGLRSRAEVEFVGDGRRLLLREPSANTPYPLARTFAPPPPEPSAHHTNPARRLSEKRGKSARGDFPFLSNAFTHKAEDNPFLKSSRPFHTCTFCVMRQSEQPLADAEIPPAPCLRRIARQRHSPSSFAHSKFFSPKSMPNTRLHRAPKTLSPQAICHLRRGEVLGVTERHQAANCRTIWNSSPMHRAKSI